MYQVVLSREGHEALESKRNLHAEQFIAHQAVGQGIATQEDVGDFMIMVLLTCAFMVGEFQFAELALSMFNELCNMEAEKTAEFIYSYIMRFDATGGKVFPKTLKDMKDELAKADNSILN